MNYDQQEDPNIKPERRMGHGMMYVFWLLVLALLGYLFGNWEESRYNPNREVRSQVTGSMVEVKLERNPWGHYVANGLINGKPVTYLLDTGATNVSIPGHLAKEIGLERGAPFTVSTANGTIQVYRTRLNSLSLGDIKVLDIHADINPHMQEDEVLLGMSVLKHLELVQRGNTLILRQYK